MPGKVCCCCNNLIACTIIAILFAFWHIYFIIDYITLSKSGLPDQIKLIFFVIVIFIGVLLISDILLLIGSIKKVKGLLRNWTIIAIIGIALELIFIIKYFSSLDKPIIIGTIIRSILTIWAIIAVNGGMKEIDEQRREPGPENISMAMEPRPTHSSNRQTPLPKEDNCNEVGTKREDPNFPHQRPGHVSGGVSVNRYGMAHADSDEDLILKHLM